MYIIETRAADGYQITNEKVYFEIQKDGEIVKANLKNEKVPVDVPDTFSKDNHILEIVGGSFILYGIGAIVYVKKRKRKNTI